MTRSGSPPGQMAREAPEMATPRIGFIDKDVRLCVDQAESLGVPTVIGAAVRQMLAVTNAKFGPTSDFTSITGVVEERARVEVRG
jgi:3-hydroxyisobutyrate dehydrogenase-like beta-hydroxyacid dehydrogenase